MHGILLGVSICEESGIPCGPVPLCPGSGQREGVAVAVGLSSIVIPAADRWKTPIVSAVTPLVPLPLAAPHKKKSSGDSCLWHHRSVVFILPIPQTTGLSRVTPLLQVTSGMMVGRKAQPKSRQMLGWPQHRSGSPGAGKGCSL